MSVVNRHPAVADATATARILRFPAERFERNHALHIPPVPADATPPGRWIPLVPPHARRIAGRMPGRVA